MARFFQAVCIAGKTIAPNLRGTGREKQTPDPCEAGESCMQLVKICVIGEA